MKSRLLGSVDLDPRRLADDLAAVQALPFNGSYREFAFGDLASSMLFNRTGDTNDIHIETYTGTGQLTAAGHAMPYVLGVATERFDLTTLRFARLIRLGPNTVLFPHRDYLELDRRFTRIHVPLRTDEQCFTAEDEIIYQMRLGEVWFIDASRLHSAASFSPVHRIHMLLDFDEADEPLSLLRVPEGGPGNGAMDLASHIVNREPIGAAQKRALDGLSGVLAYDNLTEVLSILVKTCYQRDVPMGRVYGWLQEMATVGGRPDVASHICELEKYLVTER